LGATSLLDRRRLGINMQKPKKWKPAEITAYHADIAAKWRPSYIIAVGSRRLFLRDDDHQILLARPGFNPSRSTYSDIISVELVPEYRTKSTVRGGGVNITGAALGAMAFGPAGAIIGAMGKKQKIGEQTWLANLELHLTARFDGVVHTVAFSFHYAAFPSLSKGEEKAIRTANTALGYLRHAMQLASRAA
jgi:hypothetical protein